MPATMKLKEILHYMKNHAISYGEAVNQALYLLNYYGYEGYDKWEVRSTDYEDEYNLLIYQIEWDIDEMCKD